MIRQQQTRFIRKALYSLKRQYGFEITLHKKLSEVLNFEDGTTTHIVQTQKIRRAIILPDAQQRKFEYDLAFIAAAKNFTYGGFYDTSLRRIIIDRQDVGDFKIELGDYFIWDEGRWEIAKVGEYELQTGYLLHARLVEGVTRYQVTEVSLESNLTFSHEVS